MGIITLLISISITIALTFLTIFIWNLRHGQFDDTTTPAMRMLFEDSKNEQRAGGEQKRKTATSDKSQLSD